MAPLLGRLERLGFRLWRRTPLALRLFLIRRGTPSYHVGAMCVIERPDGALLLIRNSYRRGWGFPGGFLKRGESPDDAARRETSEEIGVQVDIDANPKVVVDARLRRVDVIFTGRLTAGAATTTPAPRSAEILEAQWFPPHQLPDLQPEAVTALIEVGRAHRPPWSSP
ncbi:MAG TPA: NUDIX hydrolase [Acidimicrobiales bacterium]|jgi:ADP-ribose pyrophosphatase YjhB (NUDIX family)|nr:NUDIX hydrolase [Acidimicrobiales bacterium]